MEDERRRPPRVRLDGRAAGRATILAPFHVVSLSETGALVEMDLPLAQGSTCDLTLNLSGGQVDVKSVVASVERADPGYQVGLDFVSVDQEDQPILQAFLARERKGRQ